MGRSPKQIALQFVGMASTDATDDSNDTRSSSINRIGHSERRGTLNSAGKPKPNTTLDGAWACAFGTPWLDHWDPPTGTGKGCPHCDAGQRQEKA